ncbi:MAG: sugar phosphate isomerase/epimerase [Treponema sp.]|jgi:sugar phosphate isomerase/epimerase|nr:sugar phosphate isomerase/epimerase [Treponema sp.]
MENQITLNSNSFHGFGVDEALEGAAAAGFTCIELTAVRGWTEHIMPDMGDAAIGRIEQKLASLGLVCNALSGHCNLMDPRRLEDFRANMALAARLGARYIISSTGEAHFGKDEVFADDVLAQNITALVPDLRRYGLTLALEVHGEYGSGASLKPVVEKIGSDHVGINYDTGNVVFYGGVDPEEDIAACAPLIKFVHLKDKTGGRGVWNFPPLGRGELKLEALINRLNDMGYRGPYSVEIEYTEDFTMNPKKDGDLAVAREGAKQSFEYLKALGKKL